MYNWIIITCVILFILSFSLLYYKKIKNLFLILFNKLKDKLPKRTKKEKNTDKVNKKKRLTSHLLDKPKRPVLLPPVKEVPLLTQNTNDDFNSNDDDNLKIKDTNINKNSQISQKKLTPIFETKKGSLDEKVAFENQKELDKDNFISNFKNLKDMNSSEKKLLLDDFDGLDDFDDEDEYDIEDEEFFKEYEQFLKENRDSSTNDEFSFTSDKLIDNYNDNSSDSLTSVSSTKSKHEDLFENNNLVIKKEPDFINVDGEDIDLNKLPPKIKKLLLNGILDKKNLD